ncbi:MAG: F420-0--gamma-glutamyl ligase, partial [Gammaproteobacteria bacterium]|nr:F420-0--gamma-glutamyl ligase [Gammaproteobacteria bacterium]
MNAIKLIALKNFPLIKPNDDLANIINNSISVNNICIDDNDVIVVAQKIIS